MPAPSGGATRFEEICAMDVEMVRRNKGFCNATDPNPLHTPQRSGEKLPPASPPAGGDFSKADARRAPQPLAICLMRIGLSTNNAITAAMTLSAAATMNTACQLPVQVVSTLENGISSAAVPLAV